MDQKLLSNTIANSAKEIGTASKLIGYIIHPIKDGKQTITIHADNGQWNTILDNPQRRKDELTKRLSTKPNGKNINVEISETAFFPENYVYKSIRKVTNYEYDMARIILAEGEFNDDDLIAL